VTVTFSEDSVLQEVYIARAAHGDMVLFGRHDNQTTVFMPDDLQEKTITISADECAQLKTSYVNREDFAGREGWMIAAWHTLAMRSRMFRLEDAKQMKMELGRYFPRIWRGLYEPQQYSRYNPIEAWKIYGSIYNGSIVAVSSVFSALNDLFFYVEPSKDNFPTFSHKIREALILVCTEVESAWRSVLEANSSHKLPRYNTVDYRRLVEPLRLKDWSVMLTHYPDLGEFAPFAAWDGLKPTQSLSWYDAYNSVKHHREENFQYASFENLVNAAAALHIMLQAQFGPEMHDRAFGNQKSPFFTANHPQYDLSELYAPDFINGKEMEPMPYFG
jgi:hypothetical protein